MELSHFSLGIYSQRSQTKHSRKIKRIVHQKITILSLFTHLRVFFFVFFSSLYRTQKKIIGMILETCNHWLSTLEKQIL